jgi:hypothetical protein
MAKIKMNHSNVLFQKLAEIEPMIFLKILAQPVVAHVQHL